MREAAGLAIDREALKTVLYSGLGDPAATLFPPGVPDAGTPMDVRFDPARARAGTGRRGLGGIRRAAGPATGHR